MSAVGVRRAKAAFFSGCKSHPATIAPAGSNRSSHGVNEVAEAFGVGHYGMPTRLVGRHDGPSVVMTILPGVMVLGLHKAHPGMLEMRPRSHGHSAFHTLNALISFLDRGLRPSKVHRAFKRLYVSRDLQNQSPVGCS